MVKTAHDRFLAAHLFFAFHSVPANIDISLVPGASIGTKTECIQIFFVATEMNYPRQNKINIDTSFLMLLF